ncbi:MAG: nuclease [Herminiimonas sp.]|nr:nuclease [Herminiimonas sp.]
MKTRSIRRIHAAQQEDIADLTTWRALPTSQVDMIDPFLFLNHHGPQVYAPRNHGLPFGPHPHRGFETVTFILDGDIAHRDSGGHESVIRPDGIQWMTAGRGLVHSETSSAEFMRDGGPLEILQLWINLPARLKMTTPRYVGLQADALPMFDADGGKARIQLASGSWDGHRGPIETLIDVTVMTLRMQATAVLTLPVAAERNVFFYVVRGVVRVNGSQVERRHLVEFDNNGEGLEIRAEQDALVLLCHALPLGEPVVSYGPFVMNTREEIQQAVHDYQAGLFTA